jgi:glycerol-3-phosphate acyltransferase PlsY
MAGFGKLDWENWMYGVFAGFIGGGATAVTSGVTLNMVDPKDFNVYTSKFYVMVAAIFAANGLMSMFMFLKQNPLPPIVTTTTTTSVAGKPVVKMVEEVKVEASDGKDQK